MYSIKNNILYFIVITALVQVQSLVKLRVEDNDLVITEAAIRNTVNGIFSNLNLKDVKYNAKLGEFAAIHNFFITVTLQDHFNLKEIERLAKVDNIDNNTQYFITQVNGVLNEDNKSYEGTDDEYVTTHVESFIRKLEYLKFKYGFANNDANFSIKTEVLKHLVPAETLDNSTEATQETNDTDGKLLNDHEFWEPNHSRRIFEGIRETIKEFPFMASIQFFKKFQCGGSIIKSDLVITSASCLQLAWNNRFFRENPAFLSVQVGCDLYEAGDENIPILEVYFHPEYNPKNLRNNLAIMRLVRILKFGKSYKKIKKIDIDRSPAQLASNTPGITIIGWGAKTSTNIIANIWRNRLSYAVLDFYSLKDCAEIYSREFVDYRNFCAGFISKGGGACNRDAGGPGVAYGKLVGVISFGAPNCGTPDAPTVFTKVGYYTEWIEGIMEVETPQLARSTTERTTRENFRLHQFLSSTKKRYKISPITATEEDALIGPTTPLGPDALRSLDENKLFKDFISTMFGNEDVKEYLDQFESDTDNSTEVNDKVTTNVASRPQAFKTTVSTTKDQSVNVSLVQKGPIKKIVTTIRELGELKKITTEQNIARLINDIDVRELFKTLEINDKSSESEEKETQVRQDPRLKLEEMFTFDSKQESNSGDNSDSNGDSGYSGDDDRHSDGAVGKVFPTPTNTKQPTTIETFIRTVKTEPYIPFPRNKTLFGPIVESSDDKTL